MKQFIVTRVLALMLILAGVGSAHSTPHLTTIINKSTHSFTIANNAIIIPAACTFDVSATPLLLDEHNPLRLVPEDDPEVELIIRLNSAAGLQLIHPALSSITISKQRIKTYKNGRQQRIRYPSKTVLCSHGDNTLIIDDLLLGTPTRHPHATAWSITVQPGSAHATSAQQTRTPSRGTTPTAIAASCSLTQTPDFVPDFTECGTLCKESYISSELIPGDQITRDYFVYLPHDYFLHPERRYPVLIYLHGTPSRPEDEAPSYSVILDLMIAAKRIPPMIVVFPNGNVTVDTFLGVPVKELPDVYLKVFNDSLQLPSYWTNSSILGNMENDIIFALFDHIDATYRTKKGKQFKGITGFSGGGGAHQMVLPHTDRVGSVSTSSGFGVAWERELLIYPNMDSVIGQIAEGAGFLDIHFATFYANDPFDIDNPLANYLGDLYNQSLALSPNPMDQFNADLPLDATGNLIPTVAQRWIDQSATARAFYFRDNILANKTCIYFDAGAFDFFYNIEYVNPEEIQLFDVETLGGGYYNSTNGFYSLVLKSLGIPHEFISYRGNHNQFSGLQTMSALMFHAAAFASKDPHRAKLVGTGSITLRDNASLNIIDNAALGIETDALYTATTALTITLQDYGRIQVGNQSLRGGALQIGNDGTTSLVDHTISCTILVDGAGAELHLNRHGVLGLGAGIQGHSAAAPNEFVVNSLHDVNHIGITLKEGTLRHSQIVGGDSPQASIFIIGPAEQYSFSYNPLTTRILGGGNMAYIDDAQKLQPTYVCSYFTTTRLTDKASVTFEQGTFAGTVSQGIRDLLEPVASSSILSGFLDELVSINGEPQQGITVFGTLPFTINASHAHHNSLNVNILSSQPLLHDAAKTALPTVATPQELFTFLKTDAYDTQVNKRAALSLNNGMVAQLVYLENRTDVPEHDLIVRLRQDQFPNEIGRTAFPDTDGESPNTDTINRGAPRGAVGILLNNATPRVLADLFDLEDAGEFEEVL